MTSAGSDDTAWNHASRLMKAASEGDRVAAESLLPLVYDELRRRAALQLRSERRDHTLSATALVHEAYLRLVGPRDVSWSGRAEFYAAAVQAMRRILVDHARARLALRRGGGRAKVDVHALDSDAGAALHDPDTVLAVDEAIESFSRLDPRAALVVRLRFYAGVDFVQMERMLGVSERTLDRDWKVAKRWLRRELGSVEEGHAKEDA